MDENSKVTPDDNLKAWVKQQVDEAVSKLIEKGLADAVVFEAKPAWVLPYALVIGKCRDRGRQGAFDWFICGDAPLSHLSSTIAATPREAARHFALQWQLDASHQGEAGAELAKKAEALYEIVEADGYWHSV